MPDPNELTRWDTMALEAGGTCLDLETHGGIISAAGLLAAAQSFEIINMARMRSESITELRTFERWADLRKGRL
jgi:hypothetical protein